MLTSNFKEGLFWILKPLDNLFGNFFYFLTGVFTTNSTFPYKAYPPALLLIVLEIFSIPFFVTGKLLFPEFLIRFWENKVWAVFMGVPEASVYENYCKITRENEIRFSRIPLVADAITKPGFK